MNKKDYHYALILDKYLGEEKDIIEPNNPELIEAMQYFENQQKLNKGINIMNSCYIFCKDDSKVWEEYKKIEEFLELYIEKYASKHNKTRKNYELEFINYGRTQLVYVLTDSESNEKVTILTKQPVVEFGKVKQEAKNLIDLKKIDDKVVAPIDYFSYNEQELYVTPYINQARCVASDGCWGIYIPEPFYRFERFSEEQEHFVNSCMIAKLISYYDTINQQGISACKLGGGDFMLPKGWENLTPTYKNTLNNLYLIAARDKINCSIDEYIDIIRQEFSRRTINENQDILKINHRGRVAMNEQDIEKGIEIGLALLNKISKNNNL